jgi:hypothetical protein
MLSYFLCFYVLFLQPTILFPKTITAVNGHTNESIFLHFHYIGSANGLSLNLILNTLTQLVSLQNNILPQTGPYEVICLGNRLVHKLRKREDWTVIRLFLSLLIDHMMTKYIIVT